MKFVCKVYWEMCREVEVELPDEGMTLNPNNMMRVSKLAQEQVDTKTPGAEFVPDSINCDWFADVQVVDPPLHTQPGHDETDCSCQSCEELRK